MESVLLALLTWLVLAPVQAQEGGDGKGEQHARAAGEAVEETQPEALPPSEVDLDLLRFGIEEINEAIRVGDTETARWHLMELQKLLAEDEGIASEQEVELLAVLEDKAQDISMPWVLRSTRERICASLSISLPKDDVRLLATRTNLANSMRVTGDVSTACTILEDVLATCTRIFPEADPRRLLVQTSLANAVGDMGEHERSLALYEAVLAYREQALPKDHPDVLSAQSNLALALRAMGDFDAARALQEVVLVTREERLTSSDPRVIGAKVNLAVTMSRMNDLESARRLQEEALQACEQHLPDRHPLLLAAEGNLAAILSEMGEFREARALLERILARRKRYLPPEHPDLLADLNNLGGPLRGLGYLEEALAVQESVLVSYERYLTGEHELVLRARANLATMKWLTGDTEGSRALLSELVSGIAERALDSFALSAREARQVVASHDWHLSLVLSLSDLSDPEQRGRLVDLQETLRLVVSETPRSLSSGSRAHELTAVRREVAAVRHSLNSLVMDEMGGGMDAIASDLTRLTLKRDKLERRARALAGGVVAERGIDVDQLAAKLGDKEAAVGFRSLGKWAPSADGDLVQGADHLFAHVVKADASVTWVECGPVDEIRELVSTWRLGVGRPLRGRGTAVHMEDPVAADGMAAGRRLRERILDPLLAVAGKDASRLFVCADDLVFLVPLDALPLSDGVVGDSIKIVNEVSFGRLVAGEVQEPGEPSILLVGGVDYDADGMESQRAFTGPNVDLHSGSASFAPLPGTRAEAAALRRSFEETFERDAVLLSGGETTKETLADGVAGKRYVHIATHGWFAPESIKSQHDEQLSERGWMRMGLRERVTGMAPMLLCGLALSGANQGRDSLGRMPGLLTAEELCSLDLSDCELAVLSACETNVGLRRAGQGIQSLQAALYAAGARSSITSLWKVDDAQTRRLMELFYTNLWEKEMGKAEALWEAKRELREEGAPVRDWGGWVLTGDPD